MTTFGRIISGAILLILLATSGAMASARGQLRDASGAMIICTGHGPVAVLIDQNGDPIDAGHICPDCALSLLAVVSTDDVSAGLQRRYATQTRVFLPAPAQQKTRFKRSARAPPLV